MAEMYWTPSLVEERFADAAYVMKRLPDVRVPGHFNTWPKMVVEFADRGPNLSYAPFDVGSLGGELATPIRETVECLNSAHVHVPHRSNLPSEPANERGGIGRQLF